MIHAKSVVVDGEWTLVGSSNLDALSLGRNAELNVEIHGTAVGGIMARRFRDDCGESMLFTLGDWLPRWPPGSKGLTGAWHVVKTPSSGLHVGFTRLTDIPMLSSAWRAPVSSPWPAGGREIGR